MASVTHILTPVPPFAFDKALDFLGVIHPFGGEQ